ncbi:AMP-binding protein [Amycolatopsis orientalis]|uniref:AMP-binding protein n=1 Tax=Amycolatopsis orientalis TaxID=31958 RepID=UPI00039BE88E|nr:AMP-binding protein [Amycolatopsis orientalis]
MPLTVSRLIAEGAPADPETVRQYFRDGRWRGRTIRSVLRDAAAAVPDREALVGYRSDGTTPRWTYRDFDREATLAASALAGLGVEAGDAVAVMLPNWIEYGALIFGINELGAVYTGIPVAYGARQAEAILRRSKAKVLVIPVRWRGNEHLELARELHASIPSLEKVVVLGDDSAELGPDAVRWRDLPAVPREFPPRASDEICYLGFTSGTTGEPKGAMHSHDTLLHSAYQLAEHFGADAFGEPMVHLVASPTGHHTGFIWGVVFTVCLGGTGVHVDRWDPVWGTEIIRAEGVTTFFGAPTFVQDMLRTDLAGDPDCPLSCLVVAGSSVPRTLPRQAGKALGAYVAPAWGMTECSIIVSTTPREPDEILATDGSVFSGSEAAVVDADGVLRTEPGSAGELVVRGPSLFLGYFERPDATSEAFLPGSWFRTGDTAVLDEHGWVTLQGRTKDIVIRGGENIPVADIETLLFDHPGVRNAAVVGMPDERLGERACAVVALASGASLTLPALCEYLLAEGLSKHYLPERLVVLDELPMTQSGKIQKFKLRELVRG